MRALKAFLLGAVATGIVAYAIAAALAVAAQSDGRPLDLSHRPGRDRLGRRRGEDGGHDVRRGTGADRGCAVGC